MGTHVRRKGTDVCARKVLVGSLSILNKMLSSRRLPDTMIVKAILAREIGLARSLWLEPNAVANFLE